MRKISYDYLKITVGNLQQKISDHKNAIQKADIHDINSLHKCQEEFDDVNALCKSAYEQFIDCKSDFNSGKINLVKYKEQLAILKGLLTEQDKPLTNPNLHAGEIVVEIKRFF